MTDHTPTTGPIDPAPLCHEELVRLFFLEPHKLSRNRHFDSFKLPHVRFARRVSRLLDSIRRDLLEYGHRLHVEVDERESVIITQRSGGRVRRRTMLRPDEFATLVQDPRVAERFS